MSEPKKSAALPHRSKALWGAGAFADVFMNNALNRLAIPIYNMGFGVDARWIGLAMGLPRLWDAFTDPVMGNISDNTQTRWGRRRPYILLGSVLCGLVFALMWMPPSGFSVQQLGIYLLVMSIAYYTAYTIFSVPWIAMGLEMSPDYNERTRVQAYRSFFNQAGGILVGSLWFLSFRMGETQAEGLRTLALVFGALIVVFGLLPALFVRERVHVPAAKKDKIHFFKAFGVTIANRTFLILAGAVLTIIMGIYLTSPFEAYLQTYYVFGGSQEKAAKLLMHADWFYQGISLAFIPLLSWVATHIGKRNTLLAGIGCAISSYILTWWCISPSQPYLFLSSRNCWPPPGLTCVWMLSGAMLADVCDEDEVKTGLRREGMYTAVYGWLVKLGFSGVFMLTGFMVNAAGFDPALAVQPEEVIKRMRWMLVAVPSGILAIAAGLVWMYSITEEKAGATRAQLEAKRGRLDTDSPST